MRANPALLATAYHEAGHTVIAWRVELAPMSVTIVPIEGVFGRAFHANPFKGVALDIENGTPRNRAKIEDSILVLLAGAIAQRKHRASSWRTYHGAGDREAIVDLAIRQYGGGDLVGHYIDFLTKVARAMVENNWKIIEGVAAALMEHRTLDRDGIQKAIDDAAGIKRLSAEDIAAMKSNSVTA